MASIYKIWVYIEEIDEDLDLWEDIGEPRSAGEFSSIERAEAFRDEICAS